MKRSIAAAALLLAAAAIGGTSLYGADRYRFWDRESNTGRNVAIIAGSTAAGAAVGAIAGGARGAAAGAIAGGAGGALYAATDHDGRRVYRSGAERARIIGAGAGAGALAGAIAGGSKGAIIGGAIGAAGGYVLDEKTRRDDDDWRDYGAGYRSDYRDARYRNYRDVRYRNISRDRRDRREGWDNRGRGFGRWK
jgi:hypothetical protein